MIWPDDLDGIVILGTDELATPRQLKEQVARYREIEGASEVTPDESEDQGK